MVYLKSILAGFLAVIVGGVLAACAIAAWWRATLPPDQGVGVDIFRFKPGMALAVVALMFAVGFHWEFRRASKR